MFGGFCLKGMSCAISARVHVWKLPVLLMFIVDIWTCNLLLLCLIRACFNGSYMLYMLLIVSRVLLSAIMLL